MQVEFLEIKPYTGALGMKCVEALVRYPSGTEQRVFMNESEANFRQWLSMARTKMTEAELKLLQDIVEQLKADAVNEELID